MGKIVPNRDEADLTHKCGKGRASVENPNPCISRDCLQPAAHKTNMKQQRCVPVLQCKHCELLTLVCPHGHEAGTDACTSHLTGKYYKQKEVSKVHIFYADGSEKVIVHNQ